MTSELLGQTLGSRYRFDALLGEGSFAHVYRITDLHRSATMAAKVLRREIAQDTTFIERFRREAVVLARLQHPNIVRYYDTVELEGCTFLLVDYIPGQTFQTVLANQPGPLKPLASLTYLTPLVSALQFAHNERVIHRDLKPANILIHENGTLFITDFGIARILNTTSELTLGMTVGTPLYMSPEQITGAPVTVASDVYSLGVILYRMYTGVPPFRGESPRTSGSTAAARITYEHVHLPAEPLITLNPGLDLAVQEIVLRCLEKEPRRRFRSVSDLYDALAEAIGAPPMSAPTGPTNVPPGMKLPEWSQFMAQPVGPDAAPDQDSSGYSVTLPPPRAAIESPLPATKPHLEGELRDASARTLVNQGPSDAPPTMSNMGRVPSINRVTLPHQQVSRPPSVSVPAYMAQPPAAPQEKRRWTTLAAGAGVLVVILVLCLAAIYLYTSYNEENDTPVPASMTPQATAAQAETTNRIAFDSGRSGNLDIYLLNMDDGALDQLTGSSGAERGPAWSPDGAMIAFYGAASEEGNYDIFVVNSDKTGIRNLTNSPQADDRYPTWSPDGTQLAFHSNADGDYEIYTINLDGTGLQALTSNDADDLGPDWSPEGSQIVFHSDAWDDTYDIALIDVNTREVRRLTADDRINSFPTWSPDGTMLAYHAITSSGAVNLFVMKLADGTVQQLTDGDTRNAFPDWSPDGSTIIYQSGQPEVSAIYAIPAAGGTPRPLTDTQSNFLPEWEPRH
jgi:serine/threonine protein kinase/Tol biopolymer transport system component